MPLLDHFHPPLFETRRWEGFHARWASAITDAINADLPPGYFAEPQVHSGPLVEADVATFETARAGGVATATRTRPALSPPDLTIPISLPPEFAVRVLARSGGPRLVGAVELVSPPNKDREANRRTFAGKCAGYVAAAVGLVVVDVVTEYSSRPLADLFALIAPDHAVPDAGDLSAVSYTGPRATGTKPASRCALGRWRSANSSLVCRSSSPAAS